MAYPIGQYYIDGADLYLVYGILIASGSDDFLRLPDRKESITNDWLDENGIDIDLSRVFLKSKECTLECAILAANEIDFWTKYDSFFAMLIKPGLRRLEITELSSSFYVYYKDCPSYDRVTRIKTGPHAGKVGAKFSITFVEQKPRLDASNVYVITQNNKFIIT
ncbi:hypothetical protein EGT74_24555 [Chitinophaga lutea]|uniref:Uncharacterized protein n=1 Tax=Chitinophaga lutea TaxID=2488634 RepID=A0A3N4PDQ9_9BACT|nr:hypothetical protein [Chitinophaga lutea]RPE05558.1 hypothetical protein EGT74_24555 [Chitinophaga lutea]